MRYYHFLCGLTWVILTIIPINKFWRDGRKLERRSWKNIYLMQNLQSKMPDRTFHVLSTSTPAQRHFWTTQDLSIEGFCGSLIVKCSVRFIHMKIKTGLATHPTGPFTIFEPQNPGINETSVARKCRSTNLTVLKLWKSSVGYDEYNPGYPTHSYMGQLYVVRKCRATDFEALKLWKGRSGTMSLLFH